MSFISGGTNANIASSPNDIPADVWTHVAFVLNSGTGYLYVNGIQVGTGNLSTVNTPAGGADVRVGERVSGGSIPFFGNIDEVRIWNVAKTPAELLASMNDEICTVNSNLQFYCRFNDGIAGGTNTGLNSTSDDSGNGNDGTLIGFALSGATSNWVTGMTLTPGLSSSSATLTECSSYTWPADGQTYTSTGNYSTVIVGGNAQGCDSVLSLDLTINTVNDLTTNVAECDSFTWSVNGQTYTSSTTVVESLVSGQGCPYDHTLNLTLGTSFDTTFFETICSNFPYTWPVTGQVYSLPGVYTETLVSSSGCDSVLHLDLYVIPSLSADAQLNGDGSISGIGWGSITYWLDCNDNYSIIPGSTDTLFVPTENGQYAYYIEDWGFACADTSDCITIDFVSVDEIDQASFQVSPNPTKNSTTVSFDGVQAAIRVDVLSISGQIIRGHSANNAQDISIDLNGPAGMYLLHIYDEHGKKSVRRVIKN